MRAISREGPQGGERCARHFAAGVARRRCRAPDRGVGAARLRWRQAAPRANSSPHEPRAANAAQRHPRIFGRCWKRRCPRLGKTEEYSEFIHRSGRHLLSLINDIPRPIQDRSGNIRAQQHAYSRARPGPGLLAIMQPKADNEGVALRSVVPHATAADLPPDSALASSGPPEFSILMRTSWGRRSTRSSVDGRQSDRLRGPIAPDGEFLP